jgi:hypothetical protein
MTNWTEQHSARIPIGGPVTAQVVIGDRTVSHGCVPERVHAPRITLAYALTASQKYNILLTNN